MINLKNINIYRGGVTASSLDYETCSCRCQVNSFDQALEFRFKMASKGGGQTEVLLQVGKEDIPSILNELVSKLPGSINIKPLFYSAKENGAT